MRACGAWGKGLFSELGGPGVLTDGVTGGELKSMTYCVGAESV